MLIRQGVVCLVGVVPARGCAQEPVRGQACAPQEHAGLLAAALHTLDEYTLTTIEMPCLCSFHGQHSAALAWPRC